MTSDETQIEIFADHVANVTCKTRDKGQREKSRISCRCSAKETADRQNLSRRKIIVKPCLLNVDCLIQTSDAPLSLLKPLWLTALGLLFIGNWKNGKFEDEGHFITPKYTYTGIFNGGEPVGPGRFHFDTGCEQEGEYVTRRMVRRTNTMREVVHVPVWRCLSLHKAGSRVLKLPKEF